MTKQILSEITSLKSICQMAKEQGIQVGGEFTIKGADSRLPRYIRREVVFEVFNDGKWSFDTLVFLPPKARDDLIMERRYMIEGEYTVLLGASQIGTKPYHSLLETNGGGAR